MTKIKKPMELTAKPFLKSLFYGQPGIGKSTLGLSAPNPIMIDCDGGIHRVQPEHIKDTLEVSSWSDVAEILNKETLEPYETVVFDTGSKLIDYMTDFLIWKNPKFAQSDGTFSLKGYGARKIMFQKLLGELHILKKHVIFLAHEREDRDDDVRIVRPEIGGSSGNDLIKELDLVGYMEAVGKKRTIHFAPQQKFYAKNALKLPDSMQLPDLSVSPNDFLTNIFNDYEKHIQQREEKREAYQNLLDEFKIKVANVENAEDANMLIEVAEEHDHVWDSKLQIAALLRARAKELDLELVTEKGKRVYK